LNNWALDNFIPGINMSYSIEKGIPGINLVSKSIAAYPRIKLSGFVGTRPRWTTPT